MTPNQTPGTLFPVVATIRDPLHDRIPLGQPEVAILSDERFLRLERIQQLGFVSRIWPGARHTRFEHSIGVFHLARKAIERLRLQSSAAFLTDEDARTTAAAALLHDIGHYPFSHAIEELGDPIVSHEDAGTRIILQSPIAAILRGQWQVDPERVAGIIAPGIRSLPEADRLLRGILSGPLDVDKLDYLPRDAKACGVPYGGVDTERLLDALRIEENIEGARYRIGVDAKGVSPLHSLINARQEMFDNVYWHHTNRAFMAMLLRAVQDGLIEGDLTAAELTGFDDRSLLERLSQPDMPPATRELVDQINRRHVHKRVLEVSSRANPLYDHLGKLFFDPGSRRRIEIALTQRLSRRLKQPLSSSAVLIDIPKPEKWSTDVWVRFERPPLGFSSRMPWRDVVGLTDDHFKQFEERRRLIRVVGTSTVRQIPSADWEKLLLDEFSAQL